MRQLDLFADSRDVILRNQIIEALLDDNWEVAYPAWARLRSEYAEDALLAPMKVLLDALSGARHNRVLAPAEAAAVLQQLQQEVVPAARRVLGATLAQTWLAAFWRNLATAVAGLPYQAAYPELHAAAFWLHARAWQAAASAVASIPSWRRIPLPLAWMCQARYANQGLAATWPLLVELAWLHPEGFGALLPQLGEPVLLRLLRRFDAEFVAESETEVGLDWFPAWALTAEPGLMAVIREADTASEDAPVQAVRGLLQLLILEREGRHGAVVEARKRLRQLHAGLFACYMRTR